MMQTKNYHSGIKVIGIINPFPDRRIKNDLRILNELDNIIYTMYDKSYFEKLNFDWVKIIFNYGTRIELITKYARVDRDGCINLNPMFDIDIIYWCDRHDLDLMKEIFLIATCEAVLHVLRKYKCPTEPVEKLRAQYGNIPLTIEECESRSKEIKAKGG